MNNEIVQFRAIPTKTQEVVYKRAGTYTLNIKVEPFLQDGSTPSSEGRIIMEPDTNYQSILTKIKQEGALHASLIDPDELKQPAAIAGRMAEFADKAGTDMFFVGGSTCFNQAFIEKTMKAIKKNSNKPIIIFPGGINAVCQPADAILFISILNSTNPYFIIGGQMQGAVAIKMSGMEAISTAYLIVAPGGAAGWLSDAKPLPRYKPEIAVGYALAAQYMGFKMLYLEAGSGADTSVPIEMIKKVKKYVNLPMIVGGGVNTPEDAREKVLAGADIIVQGTFLEENILRDEGESLAAIIQSIKEAGASKEHARPEVRQDNVVPEGNSCEGQ
ncbi:MAG TPA: geranylgeranylglyceryl/heptaprenylglyceryl phosphate synthase [Candidatus Lokiarchaeia archaeon]|nr:geranylgeranylglyceryl/heptaprenylglyceryl phosphate synthase [Candidatus Lokiarchaeia archaeon]